MPESNAKETAVNKMAEEQAVKGDALASTTASLLVSVEKITASQSLVSFSSFPYAEMHMILSKYIFQISSSWCPACSAGSHCNGDLTNSRRFEEG